MLQRYLLQAYSPIILKTPLQSTKACLPSCDVKADLSTMARRKTPPQFKREANNRINVRPAPYRSGPLQRPVS